MDDRQLALELIERLNNLIKDENVKKLVHQLIETRVNVPTALGDHHTIQVTVLKDPVDNEYLQVGFLGLLNGMVGVISGGKYDQWGHIAAKFSDDETELLEFMLTDVGDGQS